MIVIVGHGPSWTNVSLDIIDRNRVVRLRRAILFLGTRTDVICSSQLRYARDNIEFWHLVDDLKEMCVESLRPFQPKFWKPSTGLSAAIIARDKYPKEEIGVVGFDYTLYPDTADSWRHDAHAENRCLKWVGVTEL